MLPREKQEDICAALQIGSTETRKRRKAISAAGRTESWIPVAEGMRKAVGQRCTGVEKDFLERTVLLDGFTYLRKLRLAYRHENRLLSISYNLEWSSEVETDAYFHEVGDCAFALEAKGGLRVRAWNGSPGTESCLQRNSRPILERLSNP